MASNRYSVWYTDGKRKWQRDFNDFDEALAYFIKHSRDILYTSVELISNREEGQDGTSTI
jgi:hypothetical protein